MSTQLLGTGVDGTTPCALLSLADGSRLLLNASEGLQRLASEHRLRLHRGLDAVLLTSVSPLAAAGLPGLLLTLAQKGAAAVHICGPPGTALGLAASAAAARDSSSKCAVAIPVVLKLVFSAKSTVGERRELGPMQRRR